MKENLDAFISVIKLRRAASKQSPEGAGKRVL